MRFTIQQLMAFTHVGSPNTVYNMRRLLKELGYIDYRAVKNGTRAHVEYRLIPLGISRRSRNCMTDMAGTAADMTAGMAADCSFADTPCYNEACPANAGHDNNTSANAEYSVSENSKSEYAKNENSKSERSNSEYAISERSVSECSISECSVSESSVSESSKSECSISESSRRQYAGECSAKCSAGCSKSERSADSSPNREEKDKKRNTSHATSLKYEGEVNNNNNSSCNNSNGSNCCNSSNSNGNNGCNSSNSNGNNGCNSSNSNGSSAISLSEFYRTNGDYLLCQDAYRDYFKHEPPSEDRVRIIRFLANYGVNSTLSAMDVMMQNKADSLSCCETILRQSQWKINRKAVRRPVLSKEWEGWQMA